MRLFSLDELETFLEAVDKHLVLPQSIVVIGGGALALRYGVDIGTKDIDFFHRVSSSLEQAARRAKEDTGLPVLVEYASVASAPEDYEDRLARVLPHLQKLRVYAMEGHDVTLSKMSRSSKKDLEAIKELHETSYPLDVDILVQRYGETYQTGDQRRNDLTFSLLIEELFGEDERDRVSEILRTRRGDTPIRFPRR